MRPDLRLFAVDCAGEPGKYPPGCEFRRVDLERDKLPWADGSFDAITCMQLIEHLKDLTNLLREAARVLKQWRADLFRDPASQIPDALQPFRPGGRNLHVNFYDDTSHVRLVTTGALAQAVRDAGLEVVDSGISRNWLFAAAWPLFMFLPSSRKRFTARLHWIGWSACLVARRSR